MSYRKIINDPVHGFITINDPLIYAIISHPWFQRLRRINQMAMSYLVYPGAVHSRLHHALGAYHLMHNALYELKQKGIEFSEEEEQAAKIAIRNLRRDANEAVKKLVKDKLASEDEQTRSEADIQKLTDRQISEIDRLVASKEQDIMAV